MISIDEALALIQSRARSLAPRELPLAESAGCVLAEDITADRDSPPYAKALMDGYAVVAADMASGSAQLAVLEEVTAGAVPTREVTPGHCTRIMTGAPLPRGAEAVVMVEHSQLAADGASVRLESPGIAPRVNAMAQGESFQKGEVLLPAGAAIRPAQVGLMAEVGRAAVLAVPRPRVAVLATGNELVPPGDVPGPGQIRNSNGPLTAALVRRAGGEPVDLGIARDEPAALAEKIAEGLACDVLILSGGVSAGVLDLVPAALAAAGVREVFHKVDLKPGKPLWFGAASSSCATAGLSSSESGPAPPATSSSGATGSASESGLPPAAGDASSAPSTTIGSASSSRATAGSSSSESGPAPPATSSSGATGSASESGLPPAAGGPPAPTAPPPKLIFGLPGNPVSTLVCFELFARPAIAALAGRDEWNRTQPATLATGHKLKGNRPTFWPGKFVPLDELTAAQDLATNSDRNHCWRGQQWHTEVAGKPPRVEPLPWRGSADLATLARADCLIAFPTGESEYAADDAIRILLL